MAKPRIEKLTYIGGGSTYTPEFVDGFIQHEAEVDLKEIALFDIHEERLKVVGGMVQRMLHHAELETKVTLSLKRAEAIEGAEFIVSAIRVGGMEARILDEKIPLTRDVIGQETSGPGGTLKAWRTIPVALDIAGDAARYAPGSWFLNFTNPSGIITEALIKHTDLKVVGLCNNPINFQTGMAMIFGVQEREVFLEWMGLNHVNWVRRIFARGKDVTPELMARLDELSSNPALPPFDPELVRTLGVLPTYYPLAYYYNSPEKVRELKAAEKTRGETVREVEEALLRQYSDPNQVVKPPELSLRGGALYSEAAMRVILSLLFDRRDVQIVVTRNGGSLPDLPPDASVEVPCVVGAHGVTPLMMGALPESIRPLCIQAKAWESATVQAGVTGSWRDARLAMMLNPLVPSYDIASVLVDEMLEANRAYLPQFFPT
ncbi:MAG TPA: 6-phospho-beta-glucosidase [Anaerolineales bacterium]|nr:6-phospho-beta-glucosidase [Anaerolineales bacterium]